MEPETPHIASPASPDVLVVGAGIFGLSVAWACHSAGMSVRVLEAGRVGDGASGGVVGALTPHAPTRWRPMMAFQFAALQVLSQRIAEIEAATGRTVGYARTGRLSPLPDAAARVKAEAEVAAAPEVWGSAARLDLLGAIPTVARGWIAPDAAAFGVLRDSVSARVDPRAYVSALAAGLGAVVEQGVPVASVDAASRSVVTDAGRRAAGVVVLAAGQATWSLAATLAPALAAGTAVKGQAAVLAVDADALPVIWQQGLYIVPHGAGRVAVGSTSEKRFDDPGTDAQLDDLLARARATVPRLGEAKVLERWAGMRPKPPGREPVVGQIAPGVWVAGGGFKIGFGIAHAVGDAVAAGIAGTPAPIALPETFAPPVGSDQP